MSSPIVITGVGLITPLGLTLDVQAGRLRGMESSIGPLERFAGNPAVCGSQAAVEAFDVTEGMRHPKASKFMNDTARYAVRSALDAVRHSRCAGQFADERVGVYTGGGQTGLEPGDFLRSLSFAWSEGRPRDYRHLGGRASRMIDRYFSLKTLANGSLGMISNELRARGPSANYVHGETASLMAVQNAWFDLKEGRCDAAIATGYDCLLHPTLYIDYQARGILSLTAHACAYRPFDRERDGIVPGEGAGSFVLEREDEARARGATIHGEILHVDCGMDAASVIEGALEAAEPDFVVAHGFGTQEDDRREAALLGRLLGPSMPLTALKSRTGYLGAATTTVELALGLLASAREFIPAVARLVEPDSDCGLDLVRGEARVVPKGAVGLFVSRSLTGQTGVIAARPGVE